MEITREIAGACPDFTQTIADILRDIEHVLTSGMLTQGAHLNALEQEFAAYIGTDYAVGVNSGGAALELALKAIGIAGKEVIVPTDTFVASANSVILAGGTPVLCDIQKETLCLDLADMKRRLTARTAGVMFVHMFGLIPSEIHALQVFCREHDLFLIEDAAHAHGAHIDGIKAGNLGDIACFSFYATKILTMGEGGMITTNQQQYYERVLQLRNHGKSLHSPEFDALGNNYRLSEISAILGRHQLKNIDKILQHRKEIARVYYAELNHVEELQLVPQREYEGHACWRFPAYVNADIRERLQTVMQERHGVRITWMYCPPVHLQPFYRQTFGYRDGDLPQAERLLEQLVCLPVHTKMTVDDARYVAKALIKELMFLK